MKVTTLYIDLKKTKNNLFYYLKNSSKKCIVILKSNAYGLGMVRIGKYLENENIEMYAVATLDEAITLRNNGIKKDILLLGVASYNDLQYCYDNNITLSIVSFNQFYELKKTSLPLKVHLKIDTGMHRLGIPSNLLSHMIDNIHKRSPFILKGIYTHYIGGVDELDYLLQQQKVFDNALKNINLTDLLIHDCSTNSYNLINSSFTNSYRIGMGLYNKQQILKIVAPVINVIKVKKYQCVSYNCSFICPDDGYILTIPFGYSDGWLRSIPLLHKNFIQAGLMTMNYTMLFTKEYNNEKKITITGDKENTLIKYQSVNNISVYEIIASLNPFLKRVYLD